MLKGAFGGGNENVNNGGEMTVDEKCYIWGKKVAKFCNFSGVMLLLLMIYKALEAIYYGTFTLGASIGLFLIVAFGWLLWKVFMVKIAVTVRRWIWGVSENIKM